MNNIKDLLILHEGLKLTTYRCTANKLTIGVGHNLESKPIPGISEGSRISKEQALEILNDDLEDVIHQLDHKLPWWRDLNEARRAVLMDMCFNLGIHSLCKFIVTLDYVKKGEYKKAANGMLVSKWARQVGNRAKRLAKMMETGEWL